MGDQCAVIRCHCDKHPGKGCRNSVVYDGTCYDCVNRPPLTDQEAILVLQQLYNVIKMSYSVSGERLEALAIAIKRLGGTVIDDTIKLKFEGTKRGNEK